VEYLINMVDNGMIVHDRPNTWLDKPDNFIDVVFIYCLRLINFFNPYASTFSILHLVYNFFQTFSIASIKFFCENKLIATGSFGFKLL
jgi:hypothetical protein